MLRNLTDLQQVTHNATRWSRMYRMLRRFLENRDILLVVADKDEASVIIDRSTDLEIIVKDFSFMLAEIDTATKEL